jgi:hypothetical protein
MYLSAMASFFEALFLPVARGSAIRWTRIFGGSAPTNGIQKVPNLGRDFSRMGFEREVACVIEDDLRTRIVSTESFRPGREREGVVLSPYRQRRRPVRAEEFLPFCRRWMGFSRGGFSIC